MATEIQKLQAIDWIEMWSKLKVVLCDLNSFIDIIIQAFPVGNVHLILVFISDILYFICNLGKQGSNHANTIIKN